MFLTWGYYYTNQQATTFFFTTFKKTLVRFSMLHILCHVMCQFSQLHAEYKNYNYPELESSIRESCLLSSLRLTCEMLRIYSLYSCSKHNSHCCVTLGFVIGGREEKTKHIAWPWLNISTLAVLVVYSASLRNKNRAQERMRLESSQVFFPSSHHNKTSVLFRKSTRVISAEVQTLYKLLLWWSGCLIATAHYTGIKYVYSFRSQKVGESLGQRPCWLKPSKTSFWLLLKKQLIKFRGTSKKETVEADKSFRCVIVLSCGGRTENKKVTQITIEKKKKGFNSEIL